MKANFHLAADLDVEVETDSINRRVYLRTITGVDYGDDGSTTRKVERELSFQRNEARAIASALMGCASDI